MSIKLKKIVLGILLISVMVFIFCMSAKVADDSSKISKGFTRMLLSLFGWFRKMSEEGKTEFVASLQNIIRKSAHFSIFALLGILARANAGLYFKRKSAVIVSLLFSLLYAASDEFHQLFVVGRSCELRDVLIDFSGSITGIVIMFIIIYLIGRKKT